LDTLSWHADERDRVVAEAMDAFAYNTAIFSDLSTTRERSRRGQ
jgi:heme oxygenase